MKNSEQPAYPNYREENGLGGNTDGGLTKREYFAGLAMQSLVQFGNADIADEVIKRSIQFADELLKQLEQK